MPLDLQITVSDAAVLAELHQLTAGAVAGVTVALNRVAQISENEYRRQVRRTYARPVPLGPGGKPKWERSGDLLAGVTTQTPSPLERRITVEGRPVQAIRSNPEGYAERLTKLPVSPDGVNRRNPFPEDTARIVEPLLGPVFEQELKNAMGL